jgi:hypothetical protein
MLEGSYSQQPSEDKHLKEREKESSAIERIELEADAEASLIQDVLL